MMKIRPPHYTRHFPLSYTSDNEGNQSRSLRAGWPAGPVATPPAGPLQAAGERRRGFQRFPCPRARLPSFSHLHPPTSLPMKPPLGPGIPRFASGSGRMDPSLFPLKSLIRPTAPRGAGGGRKGEGGKRRPRRRGFLSGAGRR